MYCCWRSRHAEGLSSEFQQEQKDVVTPRSCRWAQMQPLCDARIATRCPSMLIFHRPTLRTFQEGKGSWQLPALCCSCCHDKEEMLHRRVNSAQWHRNTWTQLEKFPGKGNYVIPAYSEAEFVPVGSGHRGGFCSAQCCIPVQLPAQGTWPL